MPSLLCIAGPSGVGKGTLIKLLTAQYPVFAFATSHTTRPPRKSEIHGRDYHFVSKDEMHMLIAQDEFVETALVHGNMYGTSKRALADLKARNQIGLLDLDVQGVEQVRTKLPKARVIGVLPPSMEILEERLRGRGTESEEAIALRLLTAQKEIEHIPRLADAVIVNHSSWDTGFPELNKLVNDWFKLH